MGDEAYLCVRRQAVETVAEPFFHRVALGLVEVATQDGKETLYFHRARDKEEMALTVSSSLIKEKVKIDASNGREVEIVDLTEFIENLHTVDLIKIDIEGAEIQVLKKIIRNEIYKKTGEIFVETHENKISSQKKDIKEIKQEIRKRGIRNIKLNWI